MKAFIIGAVTGLLTLTIAFWVVGIQTAQPSLPENGVQPWAVPAGGRTTTVYRRVDDAGNTVYWTDHGGIFVLQAK